MIGAAKPQLVSCIFHVILKLVFINLSTFREESLFVRELLMDLALRTWIATCTSHQVKHITCIHSLGGRSDAMSEKECNLLFFEFVYCTNA